MELHGRSQSPWWSWLLAFRSVKKRGDTGFSSCFLFLLPCWFSVRNLGELCKTKLFVLCARITPLPTVSSVPFPPVLLPLLCSAPRAFVSRVSSLTELISSQNLTAQFQQLRSHLHIQPCMRGSAEDCQLSMQMNWLTQLHCCPRKIQAGLEHW